MANAIKFHTIVRGKKLTLPDLDAFEGKRVEVTVIEDEDGSAQDPSHSRPQRHFGTLAGKIEISADFDAALPPDIQCYFDGEGNAR